MWSLSSEEHSDRADFELSEDRKRELIDKLAKWVQSRGLETATIFTLELIKPLSWIGLQFLLGVSPIFIPLVDEKTFNDYTLLFEDRENLEAVLQRVEKLRDEREHEEKLKNEAKSKGTRRRFQVFRGKGTLP